VYLLVFWYPKAVGTFFDSQWDEICRQWPPQKSLIFEGRSTPKSRFQSEAFGSATAPSLSTLEHDLNGSTCYNPGIKTEVLASQSHCVIHVTDGPESREVVPESVPYADTLQCRCDGPLEQTIPA
jgi:hypothetical protein